MRSSRTALVATIGLTLALSPGAASAATVAPGGTTRTLTGTVDVVVVDPLDASHGRRGSIPVVNADRTAPRLVTRTMVSVGGRLLPVPAGMAGGLRPRQRVLVTVRAPRGVRTLATGDDMVVTRVRPSGVAAQSLPNPAGTHKLTVLPVYWSSRDSQTRAALTDLAARTAAYWSTQSGGTISVTTDVRDWAQIADPGSCSSSALFDRALAAHGVADPTSITDHVLIYFPYRSDCGGWAGLGSVVGSRIWVNGYPWLDVTAHELGHNLGLGHANAATCTSGTRVAFSGSCSVQSYQDSADVMGYAMGDGTGNLNTALADQLGLARTVTADPSQTTTVDLSPLGQVGATRAVKLRLSSGWLYLDYRPAVTPDVRRSAWAGVQAHYLPDGSYPESQLLDLQPWTGTAFSATSMPAYSVWRVPGTTVAISVGAVGATARVSVVPTGGDTVVPAAFTIMANRTAATSLTMTWTASSDAGSGLAGYRVMADSTTPVAFAAPDAGQVSATIPSTTTTVKVDAVDAAGNVRSSNVVTLRSAPGGGSGTSDTTPPTAPVVNTPTTYARTTSPVWSWTASTDDESPVVAYRLYAGGVAIGVVRGSVTSVLVRLADRSTTTLGVSAVNAAGLASDVSTTTVTVDARPPAAPTKLARVAATGQVTWNGPTLPDTGTPVRYEITVDGEVVESVAGTTSTYAAPAGAHTWKVAAVDAAGNRSVAVRLLAVVDTTPPPAPEVSLVVRPGAEPDLAGSRSVTLTWQPVAEGDGNLAGYRMQAVGSTTIVKVGPAAVRGTVLLPEGGATVRVWTENTGGLTAETSIDVRVDSSAPSRPVVSSPGTVYTQSPVTLRWYPGVDSQSGVKVHEVRIGSRLVATVAGDATEVVLPAGTMVAGYAGFNVTAVNAAGLRAPSTTVVVPVRAGSAP